MSTAFSQRRFEFTKRAHSAAQAQFYSLMFPHGVEFEDTTQTERDLEYAIDCQLAVTLPAGNGFRAPIRFGVQERFREPRGAAMNARDPTTDHRQNDPESNDERE